MLIANYDVDNLDNPIGTIHTKKGNEILKKEEIIILKETGVRCKIIKNKSQKNWNKIGSKIILYDAGEGTLIRTDKRIIYLRVPQYEKYMKGKISNPELSLMAKTWKREGKMESFSLPIEEVVKIKRFKKHEKEAK